MLFTDKYWWFVVVYFQSMYYCWFTPILQCIADFTHIFDCCPLSVPVLYNVLLIPGSVLVCSSAVMCSHQTSLISLHHTSPLSSWQEKNSCLFCNIFLIYLKSQCFCFVTYFYTHVLRFIIKDFNLCYFCCVSLLIKKKLMFCGYFENWLLSKYKNSNVFRLKNSDVSGSYQKVNWLNQLFYEYKFSTYRIHFYN